MLKNRERLVSLRFSDLPLETVTREVSLTRSYNFSKSKSEEKTSRSEDSLPPPFVSFPPGAGRRVPASLSLVLPMEAGFSCRGRIDGPTTVDGPGR